MVSGLRDVTFFWRRDRLRLQPLLAPILENCKSATILGVLEQTSNTLVISARLELNPNRSLDDVQRNSMFTVREVLAEPSSSDDAYVLIISMIESFAELILKSISCIIRPGTRLDYSGFTYIIRGSRSAVKAKKDRLVTFLRPDRISAGGVQPEDLAPGLITKRQEEILRIAFDLGWYNAPRGCKLEDIAVRSNLSRSTVAEHLVHAESNIIGTYINAMPHWLESEDSSLKDEDENSIVLDSWQGHERTQ